MVPWVVLAGCSDPVLDADAGRDGGGLLSDGGSGDAGAEGSDGGSSDAGSSDGGGSTLLSAPLVATCSTACADPNAVCDPAVGSCICRAGYAESGSGCIPRSTGLSEPDATVACATWRAGHLVEVSSGYHTPAESADMCAEGSISDAARRDLNRRVDAFRYLMGSPPIETFDEATFLAHAQGCARMVALSGQLLRYSGATYDGCGYPWAMPTSYGVESIPADFIDRILWRVPHEDPAELLHDRRTLLTPTVTRFSVGYDRFVPAELTAGVCTELLLQGTPDTEAWFAWPPAGTNPLEMTRTTWSLHVYGSSLGGALLSVTRGGESVPATIVGEDSINSWNSIAFELGVTPQPGEVFVVRVAGIEGNPGVTVDGVLSYQVEVVDCGI